MNRSLSVCLVLLMSLIVLNGCGKKAEEENAAPYSDMKGQFKSEKASLRVDDISEGGMYKSVDFQLEYVIPNESQGTMFGEADSTESDIYVFKYENDVVKMRFSQGSWVVVHTTEDAKRAKFNYSGTYSRE